MFNLLKKKNIKRYAVIYTVYMKALLSQCRLAELIPTGEAAVCDVEHEAGPLSQRPHITLGRLLLRCFDLFPSILFALDVLCEGGVI